MPAHDSSHRSSTVRSNATLAIGFLALVLAVLVARGQPAMGYELSIYEATPLETWIAIGVALFVSLLVAFTSTHRTTRATALALGGLSVATIVGLPLIRGYYFHGTGDPLTHLGWVRELSDGTIQVTSLLYPGSHTFAVFVNELTWMALPRSLVLVTFAMAIAFFLFVPLCVRLISPRYTAVAIGVFAALLLLPINTISMHMRAHVFSLTALFSVLVLYLLLKFVTNEGSARFGIVTPIGGLLALTASAIVLFHPQQAANLLVLFVTISLVQFFYRRFRAGHTITTHRPLYAQTGILALVFVGWLSQVPWILETVDRHISQIVTFMLTGTGAGGDIAEQTDSLLAIAGQGGLTELFVKLFLASAIFAVLAGVLMLVELLGRLDDHDPDANSLLRYFTIGLVPLTLVFVLYFLGAISEMYFRHQGFIMIIVTIVGAIAIERAARFLSNRVSTRHLQIGLILFLALMMPLSLATVFQSPYIYHAEQHVSESDLYGHEVIFEYHNGDEDSLVGIRGGPWRYSDAIHGVENSRAYETSLPEIYLDELHAFGGFDGGGHLIVNQHDYEREVYAYHEIRYTRDGFESLDRQPHVNRVVANGEVRLYQVSSAPT